MAEWRFATDAGTLTLRGWCSETVERARELGVALAKGGATHDEWIELGAGPARVQAGPLASRGPWARPPKPSTAPAIRTYIRLCWLVERHFLTLLPLAAGAFDGAGSAPYQFLLTRAEDPAESVADALAAATDGEARALRDELSRELARMHSLGFIHGRLAPDGLRVQSPRDPAARRLVFQDPSPKCHHPIERDLAAWIGSEWIPEDAGDTFLDAYVEQRARQDRPVDSAGLARRVWRAWRRAPRAPSA